MGRQQSVEESSFALPGCWSEGTEQQRAALKEEENYHFPRTIFPNYFSLTSVRINTPPPLFTRFFKHTILSSTDSLVEALKLGWQLLLLLLLVVEKPTLTFYFFPPTFSSDPLFVLLRFAIRIKLKKEKRIRISERKRILLLLIPLLLTTLTHSISQNSLKRSLYPTALRPPSTTKPL